MRFTLIKLSLCLLACVSIAACSTIDEKRKVDYKSTRALPPLEVPPDLANIPETGQSTAAPPATTTYSEYASDKKTPQPAAPQTPQTQQTAQANSVLPPVRDVRIERDGQARWLVVQASPEAVWPRVREFVSSLGLIIDRENTTTGVIETDWAESRPKVGSSIQTILSRALGTLYATGMRDKFRFRLERGAQSGTTEVYVSHRGMEEIYTQSPSGSADETSTRWQARKPETEAEAEMLRLLIVHLGKPEEQARRIVAATPPPPAARAQLERQGDSHILSLQDSLDRAWRRVGLSLDRLGFTVEDRDRSKGVYYVRYLDPDKEAERPGWFGRLFSSKEKKTEERYQIHLQDAGSGTSVVVKSNDGALEPGKTSERILSLLQEQLK